MATSNRSSVALPESFSGRDIEFWLRKYELCSEANEWKEDIMLKRLPTLLCGKAFAVFERLEGEQKASFKNVREALVAAFGGDATGMHIAMMEFRKRERKPEEDIQVFAYNLESLLRRAMPKLGANERDILLKQQFIEGINFLWRNVSRQLVPGPLTPCSLKARGIGNEELQILGQAKLQFQLGKDVVAVGMTNTCILGADFLKASKMLVDVGNSKLSWPGGNVPLAVELTTPSVNKLSVLLENYADVFVNGWVVLETRNI
ncbi:Hypothetical predicted protein [Paramuricea clavata]|uniref:Uncharacterized protein n=1 Tax=Paramuricea clavata TaxID=317549 RepID=A0A6S7JCP4_PARCT|nr:Hypothetical predicted protein [Paramuricea clavata]